MAVTFRLDGLTTRRTCACNPTSIVVPFLIKLTTSSKEGRNFAVPERCHSSLCF